MLIVRIWKESRASDQAAPEWRGMVEHIPGSQPHYLRGLDNIRIYLEKFLESVQANQACLESLPDLEGLVDEE